MTKTDLFRKIIREEVQKALRDEMPKILKEIKISSNNKENLKESTKDIYGVPLTLNEPRKPQPINKKELPSFAKNQSINSLLQETMLSMTSDDAMGFGVNTEEVHPMQVFQPVEDKVGGVEDMLRSARPSGNLEAVQVNVVPDFSALMDRLIQSGDMK
jgi:hypothetical protein